MKDLNLIPKSYIEQKKKRKKKLLVSLSILAASVLLIAAVLLPLSIRMSVKKTRDALEQEVIAARGDSDTLAQLNSVKLLFDAREKESMAIMQNSIKVAEFLEKIEKALPEKLFVVSVNFTNGVSGDSVVNLSGIASSEDEIATFVSSLRKDSQVENIVIDTVKNQAAPEEELIEDTGEIRISNSKSADDGYTFAVSIYLKN